MFPLSDAISGNGFQLGQSKGQLSNDDSSESSKGQISAVLITRNINESVNLHPTSLLKNLTYVERTHICTYGARTECRFVVVNFIL